MGTKTYLEMVNIVLRDVNEVPLTSAGFATARGFQAFVKESVNRALLDIINFSDEWPWLVNTSLNVGKDPFTNEIPLVEDTREYAVVATDSIDWDTFVVTDDDDNRFRLKFISFPEFLLRSSTSKGRPTHVYRSADSQYAGFWPLPTDESLTVSFVSWQDPVVLVNDTDTIPFPDRWYPVLVSRARYYLWMFRENVDQARVARDEYDFNIKQMFKALMLPSATVMRAI